MAKAGTAANWRATTHLEPDAAGAAVAGTKDGDVLDPVKEGAPRYDYAV